MVTAVVAACGGDEPDTPALATVAIATTTSSPPVTGATAIVPATQAVPTPSGPAPGGANDETVAFGASDGPILRGHLYSVPGPKRRIVIFAAPDQAAWRTQAIGMVGPGTDVLVFDMRGYGDSTEAREAAKLDLDVEAAVRFMRSRDYALFYVVGADVGGTAALKVAARQDLAAVATVSAPLSVSGGIDARSDLPSITEPKIFIAAQGDTAAVDAVNAMMAAAPQPRESRILPGNAHGAALLDAIAAKQLLADFLTR